MAFKKDNFFMPSNYKSWDIAFCLADCDKDCARKTNSILMQKAKSAGKNSFSMSDFTTLCTSYNKRDLAVEWPCEDNPHCQECICMWCDNLECQNSCCNEECEHDGHYEECPYE